MKNLDTTLYFITDSTGFEEAEFLRRVEEALEGGATILQLREKNKSTMEYIDLAEKVHELTKKYNVPLIIDDRIDVALAVEAEGVHLGKEDMPIATARKILGDDFIIGATAKTVPWALEAYEGGADYLGVGAIYPTTTKVKATRTENTQYSADGITVEKENANNPEKEDKSTKFTASHKYTTANSKSDSSVTKYRASGILSTEKSGAVPETASQIIYNPKTSDNAKGKRQILILTGGVLGAVGLLLIGFSAGHLNAEKKKSKENTEEETSLNDEDDFEF